jgi:hypothetical protein
MLSQGLDIALIVLCQTVLRKHIHPLSCECSIMARNAADIFSAELSRIIRIPAKPPKDPPKGMPFLATHFFSSCLIQDT